MKRKASDIPVIGTAAPPKQRKVSSATEGVVKTGGSSAPHSSAGAETRTRQSADRGKQKVSEVARTTSPAPGAVTPLSPPRSTPRRFPEDAGSVAMEMVASATSFSRFLEDGAKAYARINRAANRAKEERDALAVRLAGAEAIAKAAEAERAAAVAEAQEARAEKDSLRSEMDRREAALLAAQGDLVRAIAERIFGARHFSSMANELAGIINNNTAAATIDAIAKDYPDLDKAKYGYEVVGEKTIVERYAVVLFEETAKIPVVEALAASPVLLTPELVRACGKDRDKELDALFERIRLAGLGPKETSDEGREANDPVEETGVELNPLDNTEVIPELGEDPLQSEEASGGVSRPN